MTASQNVTGVTRATGKITENQSTARSIAICLDPLTDRSVLCFSRRSAVERSEEEDRADQPRRKRSKMDIEQLLSCEPPEKQGFDVPRMGQSISSFVSAKERTNRTHSCPDDLPMAITNLLSNTSPEEWSKPNRSLSCPEAPSHVIINLLTDESPHEQANTSQSLPNESPQEHEIKPSRSLAYPKTPEQMITRSRKTDPLRCLSIAKASSQAIARSSTKETPLVTCPSIQPNVPRCI